MNKKYIATILVGGTIVLGLAVGAGGTVRVTDTQLLPIIQTEQLNYFSQFGYYFQVLPTHSDIPTMGSPVIADLLRIPQERKDVQTSNPLTFLKLQANKDYESDFRLTVDTCEVGNVHGYVAKMERINGTIETKEFGIGPCAINHDWQFASTTP